VRIERDRISHTWDCASADDAPEDVNMESLIIRMRALVRDESGQDLIEYALLAALIALAAVVAIRAAGVQVNTIFGNIVTALTPA
jgi:pilus assembly protein Flp/PilA